MQSITFDELVELEAASEVLSRRHGAPKVFLRPDGRVYKLFGSRWRWKPSGPVRKAYRFRHNARRLKRLGIPCPEVLDLLDVAGREAHLVIYRRVAGEVLRDSLAKADRSALLPRRLAAFVARMHDAGAYFMAGHLGNYIVQPDGEFAIIDQHELWISPFRLGAVHRAGSFRILMKYPEDRALLAPDGNLARFVDDYLASSRLGAMRRSVFMRLLPLYVPALAAGRPDLRAGGGA